MPFSLFNARLVDAAGEVAPGAISIAGARIEAVAPGAAPVAGIDLAGAIVTPGFVDVHVHGGGGFNLHSSEVSEIQAYARWAPTTGTTAFLAGVVGVPGGLPDAQVRAVVAAARQDAPGAEILGIHLEGPYLNPVRRGAHHPAWLRLPSEEETAYLLAVSEGYLKLMTLAPELPGGDVMITQLVDAGVTVSIGHTDASYEQARAAIPLGIRHATHCFNAMRPLLHREPGPLGAICEADQVQGELIADGVHVHPATARALIRALGAGRMVVVTDALPAAGLTEAIFTFGDQPAQIVGGVARLADGTIAGSLLTMDQGLRNVWAFAGGSLSEAIGMLTLNPARDAGVAGRKGLLQPGYDADLLILDGELQLQATICRGRLAFATPAWQPRLSAVPAM
jgi:N-acetylglucosamine-6-phosphate deacetylase